MTIKTFVITTSMTLFLILSPLGHSFSMDSSYTSGDGKLYFYSRNKLLKFLKKISYPDYDIKATWDIARSADGTSLIFFSWSKNKALIVSCNNTIKEMALPGTPSWDSRPIWIDNKYQVIAWANKGEIYYENNKKEESCDANKIINTSGIYFIRDIKSSDNKDISIGTAIHSIKSPEEPLIRLLKFHGNRIFVKNNKIIIFGDYYIERENQTEMYAFEIKRDGLIQSEKLIIHRPNKSPAPFLVVDYSPWDDEVLFSDVHDFPSRSEWYVYKIKTQEMKRIGKEPIGGGWGFYLQCDIVKKVTEKFNKSKD
jgi:hypothetical protein